MEDGCDLKIHLYSGNVTLSRIFLCPYEGFFFELLNDFEVLRKKSVLLRVLMPMEYTILF